MNRPMQQLIQHVAYGLLITITTGLVLVSASGLLWARTHDASVLSVQTASMVPTFKPGDAVIVQRIQVSQLHVGDIISYNSPQDQTLIISHRLVHIDLKTGWLTTKGDHLSQPDPTFPPRLVVGRVIAMAPRFGIVLDSLRRPLGLALLVYLPALLLIVAELKRLNKQQRSVQLYRTPHY